MSTTLAPETVLAPVQPATEVAVVLEDAALLLEKVGWVPRCPLPTGELCVGVAIIRATRDEDLQDRVIRYMERHLGIPVVGMFRDSLPTWNDQQTDVRDVTRALREAAATAL